MAPNEFLFQKKAIHDEQKSKIKMINDKRDKKEVGIEKNSLKVNKQIINKQT